MMRSLAHVKRVQFDFVGAFKMLLCNTFFFGKGIVSMTTNSAIML